MEVARARAIIDQVELRSQRPEIEPATVLEWDNVLHLAYVHLDSSVGTSPTPCYSMVEDVASTERVYVQHNPPHTALIVGRAAPAIHTAVPDWTIESDDPAFSLGTDATVKASYVKRGPECQFRWAIAFGTSPAVGTARWRFPLPIPVSEHANYTDAGFWLAGGSCLWQTTGSGGSNRTFVAALRGGTSYAYVFYTGSIGPLGGADGGVGFPGGQGKIDAWSTEASGGWFSGLFIYPTD